MTWLSRRLLRQPLARPARRPAPAARLGVLALEDRLAPTAVPTTGPNGRRLELVETLSVSMMGPDPVLSTKSLTANASYVVVAAGSALIDDPGSVGGGTADAEFIRYNAPNSPQDLNSLGKVDMGVRLSGGLVVDHWGGYQSDHSYVATVTSAAGGRVSAYYKDQNNESYYNNGGTLSVRIYREKSATWAPDPGAPPTTPLGGSPTSPPPTVPPLPSDPLGPPRTSRPGRPGPSGTPRGRARRTSAWCPRGRSGTPTGWSRPSSRTSGRTGSGPGGGSSGRGPTGPRTPPGRRSARAGPTPRCPGSSRTRRPGRWRSS